MTSEPLSIERLSSSPKLIEMIRMIDEQPKYYRKGLELGQKISTEELSSPRTVFFYGLGGSGIVGLLSSIVFSAYSRTPILASNALRVPEWLMPDDLLIVVSYSGETSEVLRAFNEALKKGIRLVAMTSGGSLAEFARRQKVQLIELTKGFPPRMALPEMTGAAASVLDVIGITSNLSNTLLQAAEKLVEVADINGPASSYEDNIAKKAALHLSDGLPHVFCYEHLYLSGLRLKNQLNENAKYPCIVHEIPESMHNTLEALPYAINDKYIFFRSSREPMDVSVQIDFLKSLLDFKVMDIWFSGDSLYETIASIMWSDYLSIYLAALRGVDPITVARISSLRKKIEESLKKT